MNRFAILCSCGLLLGCTQQSEAPPTSNISTKHSEGNPSPQGTLVAFNIDGAPTVEFEVPAMMCPEGCVPKVREAFAEQPGVKDVQVVYVTKTAIIAIDEEQFNSSDAIATLVDEYGFTGTRLKTTNSPPVNETGAEGNAQQAG
jgi:copper chaperone CopZ